jgi:hypothetical protein
MKPLKITRSMRGKMEGFHSLNTSPRDNDYCGWMASDFNTICSKCYSIKSISTAGSFASNCRNAWKHNGDILQSRILTHDELPITKQDFFRFSAHGELHNETHYKNLGNIAKANPNTRYVLWTKRKNIIKKHGNMGVENLTLIYSQPIINKIGQIPTNYDKIFTVFDKQHSANVEINCGGNKCKSCLICYTENNITRVNEHLK